MHILIIEDNRDIAENISQYLEAKEHVVDYAGDGVTGLHLATVNEYDVVVLDLMLPGMDGLLVCSKLRQESKKNTPVLMLTARDALHEKLAGFEAGGDDYLVKPFALAELEVRLTVLHRRVMRSGAAIIKVADLEYNTETLSLKRAGQSIHLRPTTRKILILLMKKTHRVVTRAEIENEIWNDNPPDGDVLRAHIYAIRNAIDKPFGVKLLHTLHSTGFRLCLPEDI